MKDEWRDLSDDTATLYRHAYRLMHVGLMRTPATAERMARDLVRLVNADGALMTTVYLVLIPRIQNAEREPWPAVDAALSLGLILEQLRRAPAVTRDAKKRDDNRKAFRLATAARWADERAIVARVVNLARKLAAQDPEEFGPRCRKTRADAVAMRLEMDEARVLRILKDRRA